MMDANTVSGSLSKPVRWSSWICVLTEQSRIPTNVRLLTPGRLLSSATIGARMKYWSMHEGYRHQLMYYAYRRHDLPWL